MKLNGQTHQQGVLTLLAVGILAGCQTLPENMTGESGPLFRRGIISQVGDNLHFKPCYVQKGELISDRSGRLKEFFQQYEVPAAYAELSGDHLYLGEPWAVYKVHMLSGNQLSCSYELSGNHYRAAGEKPVWVVDVRDEGIYVQNYGRLSQLIFPATEPVQQGNGLEWNSSLTGFNAYDLTLRLLQQRCTDRYGAVYQYRSEMVLNGKMHFGCARQGDLDTRTLPGLYRANLAGVRGEGRFITLDLTVDGQAQMNQDYRNNQPVIKQQGSWKRLDGRTIILELNDDNSRAEKQVLIFERDKQGALKMKGYNSTYGRSGLRLERVGPAQSYRKSIRVEAAPSPD